MFVFKGLTKQVIKSFKMLNFFPVSYAYNLVPTSVAGYSYIGQRLDETSHMQTLSIIQNYNVKN